MSKPGRPRRTASEWSELIERQGASGLSQRDFCDAEGLAVSTFTYWKRKLSGAPVAKPRLEVERPLFTPIQALPDSAQCPHPDDAGSGGWAIDLDLGDGLRLTIRKVA